MSATDTQRTAPASDLPPLLPPSLAASGIRSHQVAGVNGLSMHLLEAGHEAPGRPVVLLLHGFPELAYSWRRVMPALAAAGFHVLAPDQRGFGRTTGWDAAYEADLWPYRMPGLVRDALGLLAALDLPRVHAVVGHDFGAPVAAWGALLRPDVFGRLVLMSAPFGGPPALPPFGSPPAWLPSGASSVSASSGAAPAVGGPGLARQLAALPQPRQHYQAYYGTRSANAEMWRPPQGLHAMLRAYYHQKSADWPANLPAPLPSWRAEDLARLPGYYLMPLGQTMAQTVAPEMPDAAQIAANRWLPDDELAFYSAEFQRTGFQGGLNWYRAAADARFIAEQQTWAGRTLAVPTLFIAGAQDWGVHQKPGEFERMQRNAGTWLRGVHLLRGAGHWVQQEQAEAVNARLVEFLRGPG